MYISHTRCYIGELLYQSNTSNFSFYWYNMHLFKCRIDIHVLLIVVLILMRLFEYVWGFFLSQETWILNEYKQQVTCTIKYISFFTYYLLYRHNNNLITSTFVCNCFRNNDSFVKFRHVRISHWFYRVMCQIQIITYELEIIFHM